MHANRHGAFLPQFSMISEEKTFPKGSPGNLSVQNPNPQFSFLLFHFHILPLLSPSNKFLSFGSVLLLFPFPVLKQTAFPPATDNL